MKLGDFVGRQSCNLLFGHKKNVSILFKERKISLKWSLQNTKTTPHTPPLPHIWSFTYFLLDWEKLWILIAFQQKYQKFHQPHPCTFRSMHISSHEKIITEPMANRQRNLCYVKHSLPYIFIYSVHTFWSI